MKKILVVDDSTGWTKFHNDMIQQIYKAKVQVDLAYSAKEGYDKAYNNISSPYNLIITDLQMELDFEPKYAGEWLVEQIQLLNKYALTPIIIMSACYNIKMIADSLNVEYLPKSKAANDYFAYKTLIEKLLRI